MSDTVLCPACQKVLPVKGIPKHTNGCPKWQAVIGTPPNQFNFDRHYKRGLYADGLAEGTDYVQCCLCDFRAKRLMDHLKNVHKLDEAGYHALHPNAPVRLASTLQARVSTVRARYGADNVFQTDDVKAKSRETAQAKYGVDHAATAPQTNAKRNATVHARYGVSNVFQTADVKAKTTKTMLDRYGATSPQQVPRIRLQTMRTNLGKYGAEYLFQSDGFLAKTPWFLFSRAAPNKLEQAVAAMCPPNVFYTGDGKYWLRVHAKRNRNPDFIVLSEGQAKSHADGVPLNELRAWKVIEVLGDFFHGPTRTGQSKEDHQNEMVQQYADIGIDCLILWESEIKQHPARVAQRLRGFLGL